MALLFETPIWPPWRHVKTLFGPVDSTIVTQPLLIGVTLDQWHQKTYVYHSCVFTGKCKKYSCFFSPACNAVNHDVEQNAVVLYPGFQRVRFSYRYWWFAAKRREKRMTSGHKELRVSFPCNFRIILSHQNGLELMCMFVFIDADCWDLIVHGSASDLLCMKKE